MYWKLIMHMLHNHNATDNNIIITVMVFNYYAKLLNNHTYPTL